MPLAGLACPQCAGEGKGDIHLNAGPQGLTCSNGHAYRDTDALLKLQPKKLDIPIRTVTQVNRCTMTVEIHTSLRDALQAKYGVKLAATVSAILSVLVEDGAFVVDGTSAKELNGIFGQQIKPGNILGMVRSLQMDKASAERRASDLEQTKPGSGDGMMFNCDATLKGKILERAKGMEITPSGFIAQVIDMAITNGWV